MNGTSFALVIWVRIAISCLPIIFAVGVVNAGEIRVLSANVFTGVLDVLAGDFEQTTGHKVTIVYGTAGMIRNRIQAGESGDVTILPRPMMDEVLRQGRISPGSIVFVTKFAGESPYVRQRTVRHTYLCAG